MQAHSLDAVVKLISVALTPVFLLTGIVALLGVFSARQGQMSDRINQLSRDHQGADQAGQAHITEEVQGMRRRSRMLDWAAAAAAVGATSTALSILVLFLSELRSQAAADALVFCFGFAIVCTIGAVVMLGVEMVLGGHLIRARVHLHFPALLPWARRRQQHAD